MKYLSLILACFFALAPIHGVAQTSSTNPVPAVNSIMKGEAALDRLLSAPHADPAWFAPAFLAQVTVAQVDSVLAGVVQTLGQYKSVRAQEQQGTYEATYQRGTALFALSLDAQGRFDGLRYLKSTVSGATKVSDVLPLLKKLPGRVSYVIIEDGKERAADGQETALRVGSTFKLAILDALQQEIRGGRRHWSDVVTLQKNWKSLPSGILQEWPDGSALTLQTLASLMISQSDNSASDALLNILGRRAVEPFTGANVPLLTTRNVFTLKAKGADALRAQWRTGTPGQRRALLLRLDQMPVPKVSALDTNPNFLDIDWAFTNRSLCALMARVAPLPLTQINPGVADKHLWKRVSYKGGSDWGVISMTTDLIAKNGKHYCVSITENDTANEINENSFTSTYAVVLSALVRGNAFP